MGARAVTRAEELLREAYGAMRVLLLATDVLDITEPAHAEMASAIETDLLETFRRIEKYVSEGAPTDADTTATQRTFRPKADT